jgi:carboxyl-terminal processing protease
MLPASNHGAGMNLCFPDVCLTPPMGVPVPYPNMAMNATTVPFAIKTFFTFLPALNMGSIAPLTLGDQAGAMSPFMGPGMCTMGNPLVFIEGLPGTNLLCPASGNNMIAPIGVVAVPSVTNVFFTRAGAAAEGSVDLDAIHALSRALEDAGGAERLLGDVAVVSVSAFACGIASRIHDVLRRLAPRALILDLRGCPGGDLAAAVELAADFLEEGAVIATVVDGEGDETVHRSQNERPRRMPLVLLVDGRTASAAEVFAGAMKAHGRAVLVGARTYGKGTAQALLPGDAEPGARYTTVATVRLPGGEPIDGRGVQPDITIDAADLAAPSDPALAVALVAAAGSP